MSMKLNLTSINLLLFMQLNGKQGVVSEVVVVVAGVVGHGEVATTTHEVIDLHCFVLVCLFTDSFFHNQSTWCTCCCRHWDRNPSKFLHCLREQ